MAFTHNLPTQRTNRIALDYLCGRTYMQYLVPPMHNLIDLSAASSVHLHRSVSHKRTQAYMLYSETHTKAHPQTPAHLTHIKVIFVFLLLFDTDDLGCCRRIEAQRAKSSPVKMNNFNAGSEALLRHVTFRICLSDLAIASTTQEYSHKSESWLGGLQKGCFTAPKCSAG